MNFYFRRHWCFSFRLTNRRLPVRGAGNRRKTLATFEFYSFFAVSGCLGLGYPVLFCGNAVPTAIVNVIIEEKGKPNESAFSWSSTPLALPLKTRYWLIYDYYSSIMGGAFLKAIVFWSTWLYCNCHWLAKILFDKKL